MVTQKTRHYMRDSRGTGESELKRSLGEEYTEQRECDARTLRQKPLGEVKESKAAVAAAVSGRGGMT